MANANERADSQPQEKGLLSGTLRLVARSIEVIKGKNGEADTRFLKLTLSNGIKSFDVTSGYNDTIMAVELFKEYNFSFNVDNSNGRTKLRVVSVS